MFISCSYFNESFYEWKLLWSTPSKTRTWFWVFCYDGRVHCKVSMKKNIVILRCRMIRNYGVFPDSIFCSLASKCEPSSVYKRPWTSAPKLIPPEPNPRLIKQVSHNTSEPHLNRTDWKKWVMRRVMDNVIFHPVASYVGLFQKIVNHVLSNIHEDYLTYIHNSLGLKIQVKSYW